MQPGAMQPQVAKKKAPVVQKSKPTRELQPGDLVCGECGEGNAPVRKFCSRCGSSLASAVVAKIPWWKRILPKRKSKTMAAGDRPWKAGDGSTKGAKKKFGFGALLKKLRPVLAILALLLGILYGIYAPFREAVNKRWTSLKNNVMDIIKPEFEPVHPINVQVSMAGPEGDEHPAALAVDTFKNTYWAAAEGDAQPKLVLTFQDPVDIERAIFYNGASDEFAARNRAKDIHFVFTTKEDKVSTSDKTIKDSPEPQTISVKGGKNAVKVEIQIVGQYNALNPKPVAITEIELFVKKKK